MNADEGNNVMSSFCDLSEDRLILSSLQLARCENVGPMTYHHLLDQFGSAKAALDALPDLARRGGKRKKFRIYPQSDALTEIERIIELGGRVIVRDSSDYPPLLAAIADAPTVFSAFGRIDLGNAPCLAIVGARNASANAHRIASTIAQEVSAHKIVIVSGLARGVDTSAHRASLANPNGDTIAVLGTGIDVPYPQENSELQREIQERGLVICENPPATQPHASLFPRRNRIIAGLSLGVLVIEAARRSGSLITARLAAEQSREVMATPGSPLDAKCQGSNNLLRQGAGFIETTNDILEIIQPLIENRKVETKSIQNIKKSPAPPPKLSEHERQKIFDLLSPNPTSIDEIITWADMSVQAVQLFVLELELAGRLHRDLFGRISLASVDL